MKIMTIIQWRNHLQSCVLTLCQQIRVKIWQVSMIIVHHHKTILLSTLILCSIVSTWACCWPASLSSSGISTYWSRRWYCFCSSRSVSSSVSESVQTMYTDIQLVRERNCFVPYVMHLYTCCMHARTHTHIVVNFNCHTGPALAVEGLGSPSLVKKENYKTNKGEENKTSVHHTLCVPLTAYKNINNTIRSFYSLAATHSPLLPTCVKEMYTKTHRLPHAAGCW